MGVEERGTVSVGLLDWLWVLENDTVWLVEGVPVRLGVRVSARETVWV